MGYIYKVTNCINKKVYIGMKHGNFDPNYYGSGKIINQAIKKYGIGNFILHVIDYSENKRTLSRKEKYWIKSYRMFLGTSRVYNIHKGGVGGDTRAGKTKEELYLINQKAQNTKNKNGKRIRTQKEILRRRVISRKRAQEHPHTIPNNRGRRHSGKALENINRANHMRGKKWITNGIKDITIYDDSQIPDGWWFGKSIKPFENKKHKQKSKNMISETMLRNKRICYTNGTDNKWVIIGKDIIPNGWYIGMTKKQESYFYVTNGVDTKQLNIGETIPFGWRKGRY